MGTRSIQVLMCLVVGTAMLSACAPLYGDKPEKLKNPERRKKPEEPPETVAQVKYIEDCTANFRDEAKVRADTPKSNQLVGDGDAAISQVARASDSKAQGDLIKGAIDKYRSALIKDPYNQEATLRLAIAYDMVYRKGCALALLKRIAALEANPTYRLKAKRVADEVADNPALFKGYRKDAVAAVGR